LDLNWLKDESSFLKPLNLKGDALLKKKNKNKMIDDET
jgi:hypothetical protein